MRKLFIAAMTLVAFAFISVNAFAETLAQKISRLGVTETQAFALAQKIEQRAFTPMGIASPIRAKAIFKEGNVGKGDIPWSSGHVFGGERYETEGIVLHRFWNLGKEVIYVPASGDNSFVIASQSSSSPATVQAVTGGRSLDPTLSLRPKKTEEGTEIVHEPEAGILAGANHQVEWLGGYIRYKASFDDGSNVVPGVGLLGEGSHSRYQGSTTTDSGAIGPMVGMKAFGENSMVEFDTALQYYVVDKYKKSDRQFKKEGVRVFARLDGQKRINEFLILGGTIDGYYDLNQQIENRSAIGATLYAYVRINDKWEWRPSIRIDHKLWADLAEGKIVPLEFRYDGRWKFGIGVSSPLDIISPVPFVKIAYSFGRDIREIKAVNDRNGRIAHIPDNQRVE